MVIRVTELLDLLMKAMVKCHNKYNKATTQLSYIFQQPIGLDCYNFLSIPRKEGSKEEAKNKKKKKKAKKKKKIVGSNKC